MFKKERVLKYREKTGMWGYKKITKKFDKKMTREELLDLRCKKNVDRMCW